MLAAAKQRIMGNAAPVPKEHPSERGAGPEPTKNPQRRRRAKQAAQRDFRSFLKYTLIAAYFVILGSVVVTGNARVAMLGYTIEQAQRTLEEIRQENRSLDAQIAQLDSLHRVEEIAIHQLGMEVPESYRPIQVELNPVEPTNAAARTASVPVKSATIALKPVEKEAGRLQVAGVFDWELDFAGILRDMEKSILNWFAAPSIEAAQGIPE